MAVEQEERDPDDGSLDRERAASTAAPASAHASSDLASVALSTIRDVSTEVGRLVRRTATRLTDGPATATTVAVKASEPPPHRVSRLSLANFLIDVLEPPEWVRREVTVGSS